MLNQIDISPNYNRKKSYESPRQIYNNMNGENLTLYYLVKSK